MYFRGPKTNVCLFLDVRYFCATTDSSAYSEKTHNDRKTALIALRVSIILI